MITLQWMGFVDTDRYFVFKEDTEFLVYNETKNDLEKVYLRERGTKERGPSFLRCGSQDCYDPYFCEHVEITKQAIQYWVKEELIEDPFEQPSEKPKLNIVVENTPIIPSTIKGRLDEFYRQMVNDDLATLSGAISTAASAAINTSLSMGDMQKAISAIDMSNGKDESVIITIKNNTGKTIEIGSPVYFQEDDIQKIVKYSKKINSPKEPPAPKNVFTEFEL